MKTVRIALTTAGALAALVGGAETATWGLSPLSASVHASAPQIVAADASSFAGGAPSGMIDATSQSIAGPPPAQATPVDYAAPPEPPTNADADGPRLLDEASPASAVPAEVASAASPRLADQDALSSGLSAETGPAPQPAPAVDVSASAGAPVAQTPD